VVNSKDSEYSEDLSSSESSPSPSSSSPSSPSPPPPEISGRVVYLLVRRRNKKASSM